MEEWIVQYVGEATEVFSDFTGEYDVLLGGFAIVSGDMEEVASLKNRSGVLYVEGPQVLECEQFQEQRAGQQAICLEDAGLGKGEGVLMAYLDSGIDYRHPEFRTLEGKTRLVGIYDLSQMPAKEYSREEIDEALLVSAVDGNRLVPVADVSGHGTHVAAIGSGNTGVAPQSEILMVKIAGGLQDESSTPALMRGVDYCVRMAMRLRQPMVINISFGNTYGAHDGSSLVELYLNEMLNYGKLSIVVGAGNEGDKAGHAKVMLDSDEEKAVELAIGPYQAPFFLQIWKRFEEEAVIWLRSPSGEEVPLSEKERQAVFRVGKVRITVSSLEPTPYMRRQAFLVAFASEESYLSAGIWKFYMKRRQKRPMQIDLWLPANGQLQEKTEFLEPSPETTVTIPGTASRVITVGAYDARFGQMASFSGRGYPTFSVEIKPEVVAPGVEVLSASPGGGYTFRSGTSMATPFVSGAAALLMEWGIVKGQDVFLYADRLKAFLLRGAQPLPGNEQYPNPISGWGRLCIRKSRP